MTGIAMDKPSISTIVHPTTTIMHLSTGEKLERKEVDMAMLGVGGGRVRGGVGIKIWTGGGGGGGGGGSSR